MWGVLMPQPQNNPHANWQRHCICKNGRKASDGGKGPLLCNVHNAIQALRWMNGAAVSLAYDLNDSRIVIDALPGGDLGFRQRPLTDDDDTIIQSYLQANGLATIGKEVTHQAVETVARENDFHPIRDYIDQLPLWDTDKRMDTMFQTYFGADGTPEYLALVSRMLLMTMIDRVYNPGCKADYMVVLEGPQGSLKSTACRILAGDWFSDCLPSIANTGASGKEASQHLRGKWLIEVSELFAFGKAAVEKVKAFISRQVEGYRPPWFRNEVYEPRSCLFIATTNEFDYLEDSTGGRRFWPVKCGVIDIEALKRDRDQLFAEAKLWVKMNQRRYPTPEEEEKFFKPEQEKRRATDPWEEVIFKLVPTMVAQGVPVREFTIDSIRHDILGITDRARFGRAESRRVGKIMRKLGYPTKIVDGYTVWVRP
jgi:predicted P-loop ATPase